MAVLVFVAGPLTGSTRVLAAGDTIVGRDDAVGLTIGDPALSRQHCRLSIAADAVVIHDLESLNGTFVNDVPVTQRKLADGDRIRIGDSMCVFVQQGAEPAAASSPFADDIAPTLASTICVRREDAHYLGVARSELGDNRAAQDLRAILDISTALHTLRQRDVLQKRLLELTMTAIPAQCAALILMDDGDAQTAAIVCAEHSDDADRAAISLPVVRQVLRDGVAVATAGVSASTVIGASTASTVATSALPQSILCAPLSLFEQTRGAIYLASPEGRVFDSDDLQLLMGIGGIAASALEHVRQLEELQGTALGLSRESGIAHSMVGDSQAMRDVYQTIGRVATTASTVLIRGESGTGKELAAHAIHANSARSQRPFVAINCAALTEALLESELFGHEKGAFTGALAQKRGKLEIADGGTVFLDEVGELTPVLQVKLLRVLQEREFERVGGTRPIKVDLRLVAATNRDLEAAIKSGAFRPDLYYRLNVVSLTMPALRERKDDIPLLANYFIGVHSARCNRRVRGMSSEARALLTRYSWPGNVRELENAIERAVVLGSCDRIVQEDLPDSVVEADPSDRSVLPHYHGTLNDTKRRLIIAAVERAQGNFTEAAKILGVHPNYLHRLVKNLALREQIRVGRSSAMPPDGMPEH